MGEPVRLRRSGAFVVLWAALLSGLPVLASAAFPGGNGLLALDSPRGANHVILTAQPDGSGMRQLTSDQINAVEPAWSPDGSTIAFARLGRKGGIYLIDADGTKLRRLTTGGGEPAWSPDGSQLAFIRNNPSTRFTSLFVIATDGSGERQLPCPVAASEPAWSPDGRQI